MDFTKWEKLINNIPLDVVVPFEVVDNFLNEVYNYDNYYYDWCFQECGLVDGDDFTWEYQQQDQDPRYKKMFSKITPQEFHTSPFLYLTENDYIVPFTYSCFKQLMTELKYSIKLDKGENK